MPAVVATKLPLLECRELSVFATDNLEAVRAAFGRAYGCKMRQAWLAEPEVDFAPATVRVGWRGGSLLVFAELEDADIFTHATAPNQRMWELGDVLEMFLSPENAAHYVELHVTPNNFRLQLRLPDTPTLRQAQAENCFHHLLLPDGVFRSRVWTQPENKMWFVYAEIPAAIVGGAEKPLAGMKWRASFSRYDCVRGRQEPIYSSTSPHAKLDYHRREEWGALIFV
jgi:hypothetical protein